MNIQNQILQSETWLNSLLILLFFYVNFTYDKISVAFGLLLTIYLFFALTEIALEFSIYDSGFFLVKLFPKVGEPFMCRLMKLDENFAKVLLRGREVGENFNPVEQHQVSEIHKIRCLSMGEMLDEF
ncbi:MAG TPA: hypothetical protein HA232_01335 [Methanocellales archaeon]|nr:hypothetical protein [Methanocellales archaeon]